MVVDEVQRRAGRWKRKKERQWERGGERGGGGKRGGWERTLVGDDRDEFVSFHAGKLSRSPRPMIYWATMW